MCKRRKQTGQLHGYDFMPDGQQGFSEESAHSIRHRKHYELMGLGETLRQG
jgi:hypothetical protein